MKIKKVKICNFRGVLSAEFGLSDYSLIAGANNGGKSTLIDALRCFYEKDGFKFDPSKDSPKVPHEGKESWIDITYDLTPEENDSLKNEYKSDSHELCLRKYLKSEEKAKQGVIFFKSSAGNVSDTPFYGAKNVQLGKIGRLIYIPAISKVDEQTKLSGPSSLRDLLSSVVTGAVENSGSYKRLQEDVNRFSLEALQEASDENVSLGTIQKDLNDFLSPWNTITFSLHFTPPTMADLVKSMLVWKLSDSVLESEDLDVSRCGAGFQRHFIYSLISIGGKYLSNKTSSKENDFTPNLTLILFEEPEAFLHPEKQEELARNLRSLGVKDGCQVVCTTHSPHFVSRCMDDIHSIIRVRRVSGVVSVSQVSKENLEKIFNENLAHPEVRHAVVDSDAEALRYAMWLDARRAGVFFSDNVLLTEGPTEVAFITRLQDDGKILNNIFVLDCLGKFNVHRFMAILGGLGIPHAVLIDSDQGQGAHKEWNKFIVDRKNTLTRGISLFDTDLEGFLEVERPQNSYQKPVELLLKYTKNEISQDKINEFCTLITELCRKDFAHG